MDPRIVDLARPLSKEDRSKFQIQFTERKRNSGLGILFALLLGGFGVHLFYLGDNKRGIWFLVGTAISFALWVAYIGIIGSIVISILCIRDALEMEKLVSSANLKIAIEIVQEIQSHDAGESKAHGGEASRDAS